MGKTSIEWTDRSANPIRARHKATGKVGWHCVKTSPGCANCYSHALNGRFGTGLPYVKRSGEDVELFLDLGPMARIRRIRAKGQKHFLCDMTDLFAEFVPFSWIDQIMAMIAITRDQTFQVLTKRIDRAARYFASRTLGDVYTNILRMADTERALEQSPLDDVRGLLRVTDMWELRGSERGRLWPPKEWPLRNLWIGCSVEDQATASDRLPVLRSIPAAVRWASYEPMLHRVDWEAAMPCGRYCDESVGHVDHSLGWLDWVVLGGESGPNRRPMEVRWIADSIEQLRRWGTKCFVKQDAGPRPGMQGRIPDAIWSIKEFPDVAVPVPA